jgi:hypothetical protein
VEVDVDVSVSFTVSVIKNNRALVCAPRLPRPARSCTACACALVVRAPAPSIGPAPASRAHVLGVRVGAMQGGDRFHCSSARAAAGSTARATAPTWRSSTSAWWTRPCCTMRRRATPTPTRARRAPRPSPATRQPGQQRSVAWTPGATASRVAQGLQGPPASSPHARWPGPCGCSKQHCEGGRRQRCSGCLRCRRRAALPACEGPRAHT